MAGNSHVVQVGFFVKRRMSRTMASANKSKMIGDISNVRIISNDLINILNDYTVFMTYHYITFFYVCIQFMKAVVIGLETL